MFGIIKELQNGDFLTIADLLDDKNIVGADYFSNNFHDLGLGSLCLSEDLYVERTHAGGVILWR